MSTWAEGLQNAIEYIENNLTEDIIIKDVADRAYVSEFYFQRIFTVLCGFSVAEYIRNRRMTLAAQELTDGNSRVIDVALKYGYDSPDSFAKSFIRFHGISPSAAKEKGAKLRNFAPLHIKLTLEGGKMMEYRIEQKAAFTVMGKKRTFNTETSHQEIPKYWDEHLQSDDIKIVCGMYGLCLDANGTEFDYLIADNYLPWKEVPKGYETRTLPAGTWAVFPCKMSNLQETNTKIWKEWLPNCKGYQLSGNYNIEMYAPLCEGDPGESDCELWFPIEKN